MGKLLTSDEPQYTEAEVRVSETYPDCNSNHCIIREVHLMLAGNDIKMFCSCVCTILHHSFDYIVVSGKELQECGGIIDEFHPRASRTLFVGNLDKTAQYSDIQNIFVRFGDIVVCISWQLY